MFPAYDSLVAQEKGKGVEQAARSLVRLYKQVVLSLTRPAKSSCSQFDQGNMIFLVVKSIAYPQPEGGGEGEAPRESLGGGVPPRPSNTDPV